MWYRVSLTCVKSVADLRTVNIRVLQSENSNIVFNIFIYAIK